MSTKYDISYWVNYSDDDDCNMTYIDDCNILYSNYEMIKTYRKHNIFLIEPKILKEIILKEKLEIGLLKNMTFPITKTANMYYKKTVSKFKYYGARNYKLAQILNFIGFTKGYTETYGFNYDHWENMLRIVPCYNGDDKGRRQRANR